MWCDQAKSVWSRSYSIFSFLLDCNKHLQSYILQKTPLKLNNQFKRYQQLKSFQNKRKQKEILPLFGYISKSIFPTSDWFCLITSHMWAWIHSIFVQILHIVSYGTGRLYSYQSLLSFHKLCYLVTFKASDV